MIIKDADGREADLETLDALAKERGVDGATRALISAEIRNIRAGVRAEREVAYELGFAFMKTMNWAIIHDLRLEHDGRVAQIDHLVINRLLEVHLVETKSVREGISINEHGECETWRLGRASGIASPFQQNAKHSEVLMAFLRSSDTRLPTRLGIPIVPSIVSHVAVSKTARISRPKASIPGIDTIVKLDQLVERLKSTDGVSLLEAVKGISRVVGTDTLMELTRTLAAAHKPISFDWRARFGVRGRLDATDAGTTATAAPTPSPADTTALAKGKRCDGCCVTVEPKVVAFCRFNKGRFDGHTYCRTCQTSDPKAYRKNQGD